MNWNGGNNKNQRKRKLRVAIKGKHEEIDKELRQNQYTVRKFWIEEVTNKKEKRCWQYESLKNEKEEKEEKQGKYFKRIRVKKQDLFANYLVKFVIGRVFNLSMVYNHSLIIILIYKDLKIDVFCINRLFYHMIKKKRMNFIWKIKKWIKWKRTYKILLD